MSKNIDMKAAALETMSLMIEEARDNEADFINLEYEGGGGLEVCYMKGHMGVGSIISDRKLISEIVGLIVDMAKLENKSRGVMNWEHSSKQFSVAVEEYESFGESAFRLMLKKAKKKRN